MSTTYAYSGGKPFDPARPAIVFLHGALHDHSVFTLLARWFAQHGHSVLALDLPGHGRSSGPPLAGIPELAAWARQALHAAGAQRAAWVGHSMGSLIALEAAAQAPEAATHLVMIGTAFPMRVAPALLHTAEQDPEAAMRMVNAFSHSTHAAKPGYPGPGAWLHGGNLALMRRTQAGWREGNLFAHDFRLCDGYAGGLEAAARVTCPTTFITGSRDSMTPAKAARELAAVLKPRIHTLPCGHALMAEDPDGVLRALREALGA